MEKFTFGAGNARVLLRAPLYVAGSLATRVVPRDPRLWVVGSGIGPVEGARALYELAADLPGGPQVVWLCTSRDELRSARELGMSAALKKGWRGFRLTLRARVIVVTHGPGDVNRFPIRGALLVQLWHGIPLKRLHLDSPATFRVGALPDVPLLRAAMSTLYRRAGQRIGLFPAASAVAAGRLRTAFGIRPDRLAVTGDPRDDVLLTGTPAKRRSRARDALTEVVGPLPSTVVLYAPTWRDGRPDPGVPSDEEWEAIGAWLDATDSLLLVRPHPLGGGGYAHGPARSARIRLLDSDVLPDVTSSLPGVDVLITDYSSIAYDFALTEGPVVFFAPDLARYEASRGLYEPYGEFSGGTHVSDWAGVMRLATGAAQDERLLAHSRRLRDENFDFLDGRSSERVLAEILSRLGETSAAGVDPAKESGRRRLRATSVTVHDGERPSLEISGPVSAERPRAARLVGSRLSLEGRVVASDDSWTVTLPLWGRQWGGPELPPPSGRYQLEFDTSAGTTRRLDVESRLPGEMLMATCRLSLCGDNGVLDVTFRPPLLDAEFGRKNQRALERRYRRRPAVPRAAVFFESFYSQTVACNPRAIDAELARGWPDVERLWSTSDVSVAIPPGSVRIVEGSAAWWEARASAQLLVVNDWLRKRYKRRSHQRVLQTWHGTMLKRLALDRTGTSVRARIAAIREGRRWDVLLSQNPHSTSTFHSAYRFRGPIWEEGYPRNDSLALGDGTEIRERLGLDADTTVVLYAPTWRDDGVDALDQASLAELAAGLEEDTVLLVRHHSRVLSHGSTITGEGLLDVTSYPDVADLLLVADVLVTDYSSIMFDFTATGKPIVFFTPDLQRYRNEVRGFYFDLLAEAPGPVTQSMPDLIAAIGAAHENPASYGERYARWQARFNPHDDGHAAERTLRRILADGLLR